MVDNVVQTFVQQYYSTFDANRANLAGLYVEQSQLTFEGQKIVGTAAIVQKLTALPFQKVQHVITTFDFQVTEGGVLIFVVGQLKTDSDPPHGFSQVFLLKQIGDTLFIVNDLFRLSLHHSA